MNFVTLCGTHEMKLSVSLKDSDFGWIITKFERTLVAGHYLFYNGQSYRVDRVQFDENGNQDVIVSESGFSSQVEF